MKERQKRWTKGEAIEFLKMFYANDTAGTTGARFNRNLFDQICISHHIVYNKNCGVANYVGPRERDFDDIMYNAKVDAFWDDIINSDVLESDQVEQVEVYAPIIMESITNYSDFNIGILVEDAYRLKKDNPPPYEEAIESGQNWFLDVGDRNNRLLMSSWLPR